MWIIPTALITAAATIITVEQTDADALEMALEWNLSSPPIVPLERLEAICSRALENGKTLDGDVRCAVLLRRGKARWHMKKNDLAASDFAAVLQLDPDSIDARCGIAALRLRTLVNPHLMRDQAEHIIAESPDDPRGYMLLGGYHLAYQQYERAIGSFDAAIQRDARYTNAYTNRAMARSKLGQHQLALEDLDKAISLPPTYESVETPLDHFRGLILSHMGFYEDAFAVLTRAHVQNPDDVNIAANLWMVGRHLRKFHTCLHLSTQMMQTWPADPRVMRFHAVTIAQFGRGEEALKLLDEAERQSKHKGFCLHERGRIIAELGRFEDAVRAYEASLGIASKHPDNLLRYAFLLSTCPDAGIRDGAKALRLARDALRELQGRMYEREARIVFAMALAASGDRNAAVDELDRAIAADDTAAPEKHRLEEVRRLFDGGKVYQYEPLAADEPLFHLPLIISFDRLPKPESHAGTKEARSRRD